MSVEPTTFLNLPTARLVNMIANSDAWREWLGVQSETDAEARIYIETAGGAPLERPFAIVTSSISAGGGCIGAGPSNTWDHRGSITVLFEALVPDEYQANQKDAFNWFTNHVGGVMDDIEALAGTSEDYLNILNWEQLQAPTRGSYTEDAVGEKYISMMIKFEWGLL